VAVSMEQLTHAPLCFGRHLTSGAPHGTPTVAWGDATDCRSLGWEFCVHLTVYAGAPGAVPGKSTVAVPGPGRSERTRRALPSAFEE
jgi:hypothetical protein